MNEPETEFADSRDHVKITLTEKESRLFWNKVNKDGPIHATKPELGRCWVWTAGKWGRGYGAFSFRGGQIKSHRLSFLLTACIPVETPFVLHSCDVRLCCNPEHLFLGTYSDNAADMCSKGRHRTARGDDHRYRKHPEQILKGSQLPQAALTEEEVIEIRKRYSFGEKQRTLASKFGVSRASVCLLIGRKTWKHVA